MHASVLDCAVIIVGNVFIASSRFGGHRPMAPVLVGRNGVRRSLSSGREQHTLPPGAGPSFRD